MKRETKIIRGSLAILAIGSLVAFPALAAQATDAPAATAMSQTTTTAQPAPGQAVVADAAAPSTPAGESSAGPESAALLGQASPGQASATQENPGREKTAPQAPEAVPAAPAPVESSPRAAVAATTVNVSADKATAAVGQTLTGKIEGLTLTQTATAALVSTDTSSNKPADLACTVTASGSNQTISCEVPRTQPAGTYQLRAKYQDETGAEVTVSSEDLTVYVYAPQISGPTLPVPPGTTSTVKGSGYEPDSTVNVTASSFWISGGEASVDKDGNFTSALKISPFTPEGQYTVTVTDPATGDRQQLTVYVLRANATLQVSTATGIQGGFSTDVSGDGFSSNDTPYPVDVKLYAPNGSSVLAVLATGVQVSDNKLPSTTVQIPGSITPGLYQVSAVAKDNEQKDVRLAATWIAVFPPKEVIVTPPTVITPPPVIVTPPIAPAPDPAPAPAPILPPLAHQLGATGIINPFGTINDPANRIPDLNSSTPSPKPGSDGSISKYPTPSPSNAAPAAPQAGAPSTNQVQAAQDIWPLILVGIIAIVLGLILGYIIALAGRRRSEQ